jgi:hypothetical protein
MSGKEGFRLKLVRRDNEGHFIVIKGTIHQREIIMLNIHAPNISVLKTPLNLKAHINPNTVIMGLGDFNTPCHQ